MFKDIFTKKENQLMLMLIVISVILVSIGFYLLNKNGEEGLAPRKIPNSTEEIKWTEYQNKKYGFYFSYPEHFKISEKEGDFGPAINVYFDEKKNTLPFDHFVNQSHISIYPEGVVLQGPDHFEYFEQTNYVNENNIEFVLREYKTYKGETWAIMATPVNTPESWVDFGFIWISSFVKDRESQCFDGQTKKSIDYCNPLEGDQFYVEGEIDNTFIELGKNFLNKFSF